MTNTLVHDVEVTSRVAVDTVSQLIDALGQANCDEEQLDNTHIVEFLSETLSDGSKALSVRVRVAEAV